MANITIDHYKTKSIMQYISSHLLAKLKLAPPIRNLVGQLEFTEEQLETTQSSLESQGVSMPQFGGLTAALAKELNEPIIEVVPEPEPEPEPIVEPEPELTEEESKETKRKEKYFFVLNDLFEHVD